MRKGNCIHRSAAAGMIFLAVILALSPAWAKVDSVRATASPDHVELGNAFVYQVTVQGSGTLPTPSNNIPSAFQILSGPNSNISMEFVNGRMSSSRTLSYTLRAMRRGVFSIPAPVVRDGGRQILGNEVTINVEAPGSGVTPEPKPNDMVPQQNNIQTDRLEPIFLQADVQPTQVYLQQALVVTFTLYFQVSVNTYEVEKLPSTEGFWSEEWAVPNPPDVVQRNIGGHLYNAAVIHRLILFPSRTGDLTVGPMQLLVHYANTRNMFNRSFFDSIFDSFAEDMEVASRPLTIKVKPLPQEGQPKDFQNVVGKWQLDAKLDSQTVHTNESVTLTVKISGEGNVGFLPAPEVHVPPDVELYEPEMNVSKHAENGNISGAKTFTYLLIPRRPGPQTIPPVTLSYFDPGQGSYRGLTVDPGELNVLSASGWAANGEDAAGVPAPVESMAREIRWIMDTPSSLASTGDMLHQRPEYWAGYMIPALVVLAGFSMRRRRDKLAGQQSLLRSRKAAGRAITALRDAREMHGQGKIEGGYNALAMGIIRYLADRLNLPTATLDDRARTAQLEANHVSEASRQELREIMALCDTARFSPHGSDAATLASLIERAKDWINTVDRQLKPAKV